MVKAQKKEWHKYIVFFLLVSLSLLSSLGTVLTWVQWVNIGVFNYSLLIVISLVIPNYKYIKRQLHSSELEVIKLPFCEFKLLKKYDYYFIGERLEEGKEIEGDNDEIVIDSFFGCLNKKEATELFYLEHPLSLNAKENDYRLNRIVKQIHYKKND